MKYSNLYFHTLCNLYGLTFLTVSRHAPNEMVDDVLGDLLPDLLQSISDLLVWSLLVASDPLIQRPRGSSNGFRSEEYEVNVLMLSSSRISLHHMEPGIAMEPRAHCTSVSSDSRGYCWLAHGGMNPLTTKTCWMMLQLV